MICSLINFKICYKFSHTNRMRRKALSHATSNVVGALLRLCLVTAGRQGIVKGEGSSFASTSSSNCKQTVIQASSPLTKKQNFKFLKNYFANFKISFTRKNWLLKFGFAYSLAQILEPKLLAHEFLKFTQHLPDLTK